jgi:DNA-binding CsgD family transcriptional regulator
MVRSTSAERALSEDQGGKAGPKRLGFSLQLFAEQLWKVMEDSKVGPHSDHEELLLETEYEGARYLLIRIPKSRTPHLSLSPRELEIARMVAAGHPNKIIADVLSISCWTVGTHLRRIFAKLGVGSRAAMVARILAVVSSQERNDTLAGPNRATGVTFREKTPPSVVR